MGRVSGLTRNGGNPLVDWFVTSVLLCRARNKNSPVIVMCFQWDRKQRGDIAASTFETMKAD